MLQRTLEWLFDVPPADPGQGTSWHWGHTFPWPPWALLLFSIFAGLFVVAVYRRDGQSLRPGWRAVLSGLRLLSIALLLFMISAAVLRIERTGLPYVVVMLDTSRSMDTPDQYSDSKVQQAVTRLAKEGGAKNTARLNLAKSLLLRNQGAFLQQLQSQHKLRVYTFAESASWLGNKDIVQRADVQDLLPLIQGLETQGDNTRPGPAVRSVLNDLRGSPPAALIVLTDGITTTSEAERLSAAATFARTRGVPLYTVGIGNDEPLRDLVLFDTLVDEVAFVDDPVTVSGKLKATGYAGKTVDVRLKNAGNGKLLQQKSIKVESDSTPVALEIAFTPTEVGEMDLLLEVAPQPKEFRLDNNKETRHISVRKEKIRVLLVDNEPRYEFRYLKHLLEREKTVELATVLQDADPEYASEDRSAKPHFPVQKSELLQYDVVLLGDVSLSYLSPTVLENLQTFVKDQGGGLLFISGPQFNPLSYGGTQLADLLPVNLESARMPPPEALITESFQPQLTVEGLKGSSIFRFAEDEADSLTVWNRLPGMFWMLEAPDLKPGAKAFATHPTRTVGSNKLPVIVMQRYGAGKVMLHTTDETWRWRFRLGDLYYGRYWVQTLRYLCRSRLLGKDKAAELTLDRSVYQKGEPIYIRVRFLDDRQTPQADDGVTVTLERTGDPQRKLKLTRLPQAPSTFEGQFNQAPEGAYHAVVESPAFAGAPPSKDFRVESPLKETQTLRLDVTELKQAAEITNARYYGIAEASGLPGDLPPGQPVPLKTDNPKPLWNHYLILLLFTLTITTEWIMRKRLRLL